MIPALILSAELHRGFFLCLVLCKHRVSVPSCGQKEPKEMTVGRESISVPV